MPDNAYVNMAIDEAIFKAYINGISPPTIRFYRWNPGAVSLGYFQNPFTDINLKYCRENNIDVVRRITGGYAVFHDKELTYSLISSVNNNIFQGSVFNSYQIISMCIIEALKKLDINAELVKKGGKGPLLSGNCFSNPSKYEILLNGKKIVGSAQKRFKNNFLQHGSIIMDMDYKVLSSIFNYKIERVSLNIDYESLSNALKESFQEILGFKLKDGELSSEEEKLKEILLKEKYTRKEWNLKGKH
jgi:lipoate-protein ligase A